MKEMLRLLWELYTSVSWKLCAAVLFLKVDKNIKLSDAYVHTEPVWVHVRAGMIGFFGLVLMFIQLSVPFRGFYLCFCFIFIGHLAVLSEKACVGSSEPFLQSYNLVYEQFYVVLSQLTSTGERVFNSFKLDIIIIKIQPGICCKMQHFDASYPIIYILMGNFTNHMLASAHQEKNIVMTDLALKDI